MPEGDLTQRCRGLAEFLPDVGLTTTMTLRALSCASLRFARLYNYHDMRVAFVRAEGTSLHLEGREAS